MSSGLFWKARGLSILVFGLAIAAMPTKPAHAQTPSADTHAGKESMNGYSLKDFKGFPLKWKFITIRYRKDTGEMRMTYANDLAYENLLQGTQDYPDGAIFAKIGRKTEDDPSFTSSSVPSGAKRFQFMVRDKKRFAETDGWGYVLFDESAKTFPGEPRAAAMACAACHKLVEDKGYVFSQLADFGIQQASPIAKSPVVPAGVQFDSIPVTALPGDVKKWLSTQIKTVFSVKGPMRKHLFQGTLDEIVPTLSKKLNETKTPSILLSEDGKRFSLVIYDPLNKSCRDGEQGMASIRQAPEIPRRVVHKTFCYKN